MLEGGVGATGACQTGVGGVTTGRLRGGEEPRQLPCRITVHSEDPSTGFRLGGGRQRGGWLVVTGAGALESPPDVPVDPVEPVEPGVVSLAPRLTPESLTSVVMARHSPLVLEPCEHSSKG